MNPADQSVNRRSFLAAGGAAAALPAFSESTAAAFQDATSAAPKVVTPPPGKRILLSCKLGMIAQKVDGKSLSLVDRLRMAKEAGLDGVDLDQAAEYTPEQARDAVRESGVFVHNAINHAHWKQRL
jgi:hexulose-6-phosphate isomerase